MWKWMGLFLIKIHLLRCWSWLSHLNWIGALTLSLFLKLPPKKLEPWFFLWSFFLLRLLCISINAPYNHAWNTVVMSGLMLLGATRNCRISYKNWYAGPLVLHMLPLLNPWLIAKMWPASLFYRYYFGRCSSEIAQLVPLSYSWGMSTVFFLAQLDSKILRL